MGAVYSYSMSRLTTCKDCGHQVSKRAKTCPSCGVSKPGVPPTDIVRLFFVALVIVIGGVAYVNYLDGIGELSSSRNPVPAASQPRSHTDAEIQEAISKSDDYEIHRVAFTEAAVSLLASRQCGRYELTQYGGFVKAQGDYKNQPVYFTYCGGSNVSNRIYLDISTGTTFK